MHYILDADNIGFSWVPPSGFIECLKHGFDPSYTGDKDKKHHIGYLTKQAGEIKDWYGTEQTPVSDVNIAPKTTLDEEIIKLLERIHEFAVTNTHLNEKSREPFKSIENLTSSRRFSLGGSKK